LPSNGEVGAGISDLLNGPVSSRHNQLTGKDPKRGDKGQATWNRMKDTQNCRKREGAADRRVGSASSQGKEGGKRLLRTK